MVTDVLPKTKRAAIYARVSTDDQSEYGYSLDDQEKKGRAQIIARDWTLGHEPYIDDGISGTLRHRPALDRLLRDVEAGTIDVVVVTKMDRLARNLKLLLELWDAIESYGATVVVIEESIDTSTSVGRLIRNVLGSIAEFERDQILSRTQAGKMVKVQRGEVWRSRPPYGYRYLPGDKRGGTSGRMEIIAELAPVVKRIFESIAGGTSATELAVTLTAEGVPTHSGGPIWHHTTLAGIIKNPIYAGRAAYGRLRTVGINGERKQRAATDPTTIQYADAPAIVSPELAHAAQERLSSNRKLAKRNSRRDYLLRGLVSCGLCDRGMYPAKRSYYVCNHTDELGKRRNHRVLVTALEDAVWTTLCTILRDPSCVLEELEALSDTSSQQAKDLQAQIAQLERAAKDAEAQQSRLLDLYLAGSLDDALYTSKAAELADRRQALLDKAADTVAQWDAAVARMLPIDDVRTACLQVSAGLDKLSADERAHVVHTLCTRITATQERVTIEGYLPALSATRSLEQHTPTADMLS